MRSRASWGKLIAAAGAAREAGRLCGRSVCGAGGGACRILGASPCFPRVRKRFAPSPVTPGSMAALGGCDAEKNRSALPRNRGAEIPAE
eukprot:6599384-Pyramimonas_sp.AAC.1